MKKKEKDFVLLAGESANDVTGSMYYVQFEEHKILLECGLYQSSKNDCLDAYKVNSKKFPFNPKEIEYVFVGHAHIDHCGLIPRLFKEGFRGKIVTTDKTAIIMRSLLLNSSYILADEARKLSLRFGREYQPVYTKDDVLGALNHLEIQSEYNEMIRLEEGIEFQWLHNSHCLGATQLQLVLTGKKKTRRILYTSDIGALKSENHFVDKTEIPDGFNDIVIMESTYGNSNRTRKTRNSDLKTLKKEIKKAVAKNGSVIFPAFSFARTQELLVSLYSLFKDDPDFKTDIIVDSMLSTEICRLYKKLLFNEDAKLWERILSWKNVRLVSEKEESIRNLSQKTSQIVISSSGFCTNGRITDYLARELKNENSLVCFSGYVGDNTSYLAYRIAHADPGKYLVFNHHRVKNRAKQLMLSSFSSHAGAKDLAEYASRQKTNCIILVHGDAEAKQQLKHKIEQECSKKNKTVRVQVSQRSMQIEL